MVHRLSTYILPVVAACSLSFSEASAAVHYFLIQGDFNASTAGAETFKWMVDDPNNVLQSGQDIVNAIFGTMSTTSGPVSTTGAGFTIDATYYGSFDPPSYFYEAITYLGLPGSGDDVMLEYDFTSGLGWNYYNAGGSYSGAFDTPHSGVYGDGAWTSGRVGTTGRSLLEGTTHETTYDAWVFGNDGFGNTQATVVGGENSPTENNFSGSPTLINSYGNGVSVYTVTAAPEPGRSLLAVAGVLALITRRRRRVSSPA